MKKEELLVYEMPSIAEKISFSWGQTMLAKYTAWKVNRKWKRLEQRLWREKFVKGKD